MGLRPPGSLRESGRGGVDAKEGTDFLAYIDNPDRVKQRLQGEARGNWFVFETFAADGSLAIGIGRGKPDPTMQLVVYEGLSQEVAESAAQGLAQWYRDQGRNIA